MKTTRMGILGKKIGMTQVFGEKGKVTPVTVLQAGPCTVLSVKTAEKNTYSAVQLGFEDVAKKKVNKPGLGFFKKANLTPKKFVREIRLMEDEVKNLQTGSTVSVDIFKIGDFVDVMGYTKGRGFAGVIMRHHFKSFPGGHGTHEYKRHGGSIGCRFPQHTRKNKRMPGRLGNERVTTQNLKVVDVDKENNVLLIEGSVPGVKNGYLIIKKAMKR